MLARFDARARRQHASSGWGGDVCSDDNDGNGASALDCDLGLPAWGLGAPPATDLTDKDGRAGTSANTPNQIASLSRSVDTQLRRAAFLDESSACCLHACLSMLHGLILSNRRVAAGSGERSEPGLSYGNWSIARSQMASGRDMVG